MTHYFDQVAFFGDVLKYATRNDHKPSDIAKLTGIDKDMVKKVWEVHEFTLFYQGNLHVIVRLAVYADLSIDSYIKETTWKQMQRRRERGYRRLKRDSSGAVSLENSATSAPPAAS